MYYGGISRDWSRVWVRGPERIVEPVMSDRNGTGTYRNGNKVVLANGSGDKQVSVGRKCAYFPPNRPRVSKIRTPVDRDVPARNLPLEDRNPEPGSVPDPSQFF